MQALFHAAREYLTPVLKSSAFIDKGMLTPEEFVRAGDTLTRVAPTWEWSAGDAAKNRAYLPPGKQYLITKRVPCYRRVTQLQRSAEESHERPVAVEGATEWLEPSLQAFGMGHDVDDTGFITGKSDSLHVESTGSGAGSTEVKPSETSASVPASSTAQPAHKASGSDDDDDYADMSSFVGASLLVTSDAKAVEPVALSNSGAGAIIRVRSYDISITYDNYYRTPRVYLKGYDEDGVPLSPEDMMQDIMQDYANRTATMESHPHLLEAGPHISIHPCRHAQAMKRIVDGLAAGKSEEELPNVDQYLFIFLKFIASMIPTIEYDYTVAVKVRDDSAAAKRS